MTFRISADQSLKSSFLEGASETNQSQIGKHLRSVKSGGGQILLFVLALALLAATLAVPARGQQANEITIACPQKAYLGGTMNRATLDLANTALTNDTAAVEFTTNQQLSAASSPVANKTLDCNYVANTKCILVGLNNDRIGDGKLADLDFVVGSVPYSLDITYMLGASAGTEAQPMAIIPPQTASCTISEVYGDVNGDNQLTCADLGAVVDKVIGRNPDTALCDQNGDNLCNVVDAQAVSNYMQQASVTCP